VQYVGKGANLIKLGYDVPGYLRVMEVMLKYEYFWIKIRVQGGAYGAMTSINSNGNVMFLSYRDPKLKETLQVFDETADFLKNFDADEREMTKYIIGTISNADMPLTPKMMGSFAQSLYFRKYSQEQRQKVRDEILSTTPKDIRNLAPAIEAAMKADNICIFGNETVLEENKDVFDRMTRVMD
jgi:Zn-dependent M16 (insulinase) family peptidase